ncbi:MAG: DsbA family protein [Novosphingobium sp.]
MGEQITKSRLLLALGAIAFALIGAVGGWAWEKSRSAGSNKAAVERIVRAYLLEHPEVLPEAMDALRTKEQRRQLAGAGDAVEAPFPGAVLGNPAGKVTLVEFTDYACTFCKRSVADVAALVAANPDLKVVIRELPILSPDSVEAARWALAAAEQGRYAAFHDAMFRIGKPDGATIAAAASAAGLDMERARRAIADPRIEAELQRNLAFARQLGFDGTPSWIAGEAMMSGAVGEAELARAIAAARI